jgi:elongation factor Ts
MAARARASGTFDAEGQDMAITAEQVKKLRDKTGAGMMECKGALVETQGDMEQAIDLLRKRGVAQAAKKAGRSTSEGLIGQYLSADATTGVLVEVTCESDFVARTDDFQRVAREIAEVLGHTPGVSDAILADPGGPVVTRLTPVIAKLGENMSAPRFVKFEGGGHVGQYIHLGGKIGVMVELRGVPAEAAGRDELRTLVKEIAMQIAAASPQYVRRDEVPADLLAREKDIYRAQMESSGKPAHVIDKIVEGKLGSFYEQVVLTDQASIRDQKMKVSDVIGQASRALGAPVEVSRFVRIRVGESA